MLGLSHAQDYDLKQKITAPLTLLYVLILPIMLYWILYRNRVNLHKDEIKAQLGSLYMNYETEKHSCLTYTMLFLYRRLLFAVVIAFCKVNVVLQVFLSSWSSIGLMAYLFLWQPMEADHYDFLATFNEAALCLAFYMMLLFTEFVPKPELRYAFGNLFLYLLYMNMGLNLILLGFEIFRMILRNLKRRLFHRKLRKE